VKTAEKTGKTNFFKPGPIFSKILVQVGLNFLKNFGPRPKFMQKFWFRAKIFLTDLVADLDSVLQRAFDIGIAKVLAFKHSYNIMYLCMCIYTNIMFISDVKIMAV